MMVPPPPVSPYSGPLGPRYGMPMAGGGKADRGQPGFDYPDPDHPGWPYWRRDQAMHSNAQAEGLAAFDVPVLDRDEHDWNAVERGLSRMGDTDVPKQWETEAYLLKNYRNKQNRDRGYAAGGPVGEAVGLVAAAGRGPDTTLAHFDPQELAVLDHIGGGRRVNPQTGLPEYGWLGNLMKGLVRAGAAIAGGMIAGPAGAALGSGLSTKLTGGSWSDALKGAAMSGIGSFAAQGLGGAGWDPTSKFGAAANAQPGLEAAASGAGEAVSAAATPGLGAQFMNAATTMPGMAAGMGALSTPLAGGAGANAPATPELSFGTKPMQRTPTPFTGDISKYGQGPMHKWYETVNPAPVFTDRVAGGIAYPDMPGMAAGGGVGLAAPSLNALAQATQMGYAAAKKGGHISGPGGGTDDLIPAQLSDGEHVITAREISALGGGSNAEGQKRMYAMRKEILKKGGFKNTNPRQKAPNVKGIGNFKLKPRMAA